MNNPNFLYIIIIHIVCMMISFTNAYSAENTANTGQTASHSVEVSSPLKLELYFFWSKKCPHCIKAQPFVEKLPEEYPWLILHSLELSEHAENIEIFESIAKQMNITQISIPAFVYCGTVNFGFDSKDTTGKYLKENLVRCYETSSQQVKERSESQAKNEKPIFSLPVFGDLNPDNYSLPLFTLLIAMVDSFNPCAFFVLLFLLSLLTHTQSRNRMLLIGGVFVFFSGFIYFLFMTAWLNMFILFGNMRYVTLIAGLLAALIALINIKDFFFYKKGISLSIADNAKPKLFERMRLLIDAENTTAMLLGAISLAILANTYELLCTAGFPMVYTRYLTLLNLTNIEYYSYLILYNILYVLPLTIIVIIFALTLGRRKLKEQEGKTLKLISGLMMLGLGILLVFIPDALNNIFTALTLVLLSVIVTWVIIRLQQKYNSHISPK